MTLRQHINKHIHLATPVVIGQLGHIMVSVADTAMVGQVGVIPLAGATFAGTIYHVMMLFGIGVSYAITPLVAATKPTDRTKHLHFLQNGLLLNTIIGFLLFGAMMALVPAMGLLGQQTEVVDAARPFLIVVGSSILPLMIFQTYRQYAEGLSNTYDPMVVSIVANLINIALNYVLIFGHFGFPAMGLMGAAYATLISRVLMSVFMMAIIYKSWIGFQFRFELDAVRRLFKIGFPSGLQYVFEVGAFAVSTIMMGWISAEAIAAHQIALNLSSVTYMAATGIAAASTVRIGNQLGARDFTNLRLAGLTGFGLVTIFMAVCGLFFILFRQELTALYIDEVEVQLLASSLLIIAAGFQISDGLQAVGLGVLRGLTDVKVPTLITFVAYWVISIPLGYVLAFELDMGPTGVWIALSAGLSLSAILHIMRFRKKLTRLKVELSK
ncbi:MAG: MATE family multidrug resistance protein [Cyclobacteriaceae bacterium]|jgi:MATE family multidrug resistance protein